MKKLLLTIAMLTITANSFMIFGMKEKKELLSQALQALQDDAKIEVIKGFTPTEEVIRVTNLHEVPLKISSISLYRDAKTKKFRAININRGRGDRLLTFSDKDFKTRFSKNLKKLIEKILIMKNKKETEKEAKKDIKTRVEYLTEEEEEEEPFTIKTPKKTIVVPNYLKKIN